MSKVYVYESCAPIVQITTKKTQVIQTEKLQSTNITSTIFKDLESICWTYLGEFENSYIPPQDVFVIKYNGNFFKTKLPTLFPTCETCQLSTISACTEVFFNATKCDDGEEVIVKICDVGPISSQVKLLPTVGQICGIINLNGNDFCVTLKSITNQTNTDYTIITPAWERYDCETCPLLKAYIVDSCDGLTTGITVYDIYTSKTLPVGTSVNINTNRICYIITSYEGVISDFKFNNSQIPQIIQSFDNCNDCLINYYNTKN